MKLKLLTIFIISSVIYGCSESKKISDIYDISNKIIKFEVYDTLGISNNNDAELDSTTKGDFNIELFKEAVPFSIYKESQPIWKGSYLGLFKLNDGKVIRSKISVYGGFFRIYGDSGYYTFNDHYRGIWRDELRRISNKVFIPERHKRNREEKSNNAVQD